MQVGVNRKHMHAWRTLHENHTMNRGRAGGLGSKRACDRRELAAGVFSVDSSARKWPMFRNEVLGESWTG
jgi:hypothetical protein